MTPYEQFIKDNAGDFRHDGTEVYKPTEGWDWTSMLPSWDWHSVSMDMYDVTRNDPHKNWDRVIGTPPFIMLEHTGLDTSRDLAKATDDIVTGLFYYRDWTSSGIPFGLEEDTVYWSGFWFQKMGDAIAFREKNGGIASWDSDFEEKRKAMNERR